MTRRAEGGIGRCDLIFALDVPDDEGLERGAAMAGFERREATVVRPEPASLGFAAGRAEPARPPSAPRYESTPVPFYRVERFEPAEDSEPRPGPPVAPLAPSDHEPERAEPPPAPALQPWSRLWPWVRRALAQDRERREVDVRRLVDEWSRGRYVARLPRLCDRGLASRVTILVDRSQRLIPFWRDQNELRARLVRLFGRHALTIRSYLSGPEQEPVDRSPRPTAGALPVQAPVLLLGDLGVYADGPTRAAWRRVGRTLARRGHRVSALVPAPEERWPARGFDPWSARVWDRAKSCRDAADEGQRLEHAERLLRLLSPAVRVELGLLRAVRHLLPVSAVSAATEVDVLRHEAVGGGSGAGFGIDPGWARAQRAERRARESLDCRRRVTALVRDWHAAAPPEVGHIEELTLSIVEPELMDERRLVAAKQFLKKVAATPAAKYSGLGDWFRRQNACMPVELYADPELGEELARCFWRFADVDDRTRVPDAVLPPPRAGRAKSLLVVQRGDRIACEPVEAGALPEDTWHSVLTPIDGTSGRVPGRPGAGPQRAVELGRQRCVGAGGTGRRRGVDAGVGGGVGRRRVRCLG